MALPFYYPYSLGLPRSVLYSTKKRIGSRVKRRGILDSSYWQSEQKNFF